MSHACAAMLAMQIMHLHAMGLISAALSIVESGSFVPTSPTVLELRPMEAAFQAECVPEGSVWHCAVRASETKPSTSGEPPKGRVPPLCVYFCWMLAIHRVM